MKTGSKIALGLAAVAAFLFAKKKGGISGIGSVGLKQHMLNVILRENPAHDNYHTWIRTIEDIKTFDELLDELKHGADVSLTPDFDGDNLRRVIQTNHILLYSSYPIKNGVFVTPSKMIAEDYAGGGTVYKKEAHVADVAWIDFTEGIYCNLYEESTSGIGNIRIPNAVLNKAKKLFDAYDRAVEIEREHDAKCDAIYESLEAKGIDPYAGENERIVVDALYNAGLTDENGMTDVIMNRLKAKKELLNFINAYIVTLFPIPAAERKLLSDTKSVVYQNRLLDITRDFVNKQLDHIRKIREILNG